MKHVGLFKTFLADVVDLNTTRLDQLDSSVEAIKKLLRDSDWEPTVKGYTNQGSWAQKTIIRPIAGSAFDADILVRVAPVEGWEAKDYINSLKRVFSASSTSRSSSGSGRSAWASTVGRPPGGQLASTPSTPSRLVPDIRPMVRSDFGCALNWRPRAGQDLSVRSAWPAVPSGDGAARWCCGTGPGSWH